MISIQFDVFDLSFIFFIALSQTISVINRSGACYFLHASNQWLVCWRVCWHVRMRLHTSNGKDCSTVFFKQFCKFISKCRKEILRFAPPSSHVCDFYFSYFIFSVDIFCNNLHDNNQSFYFAYLVFRVRNNGQTLDMSSKHSTTSDKKQFLLLNVWAMSIANLSIMVKPKENHKIFMRLFIFS